MAEHRHEWTICENHYFATAKCECGEEISDGEIERRLNDLERHKLMGCYPIPSTHGFVISDRTSPTSS